MGRSSTTFKKGDPRTKEIAARGGAAKKGKSFSHWKNKLEEVIPGDKHERSYYDMMLEVLLEQAKKGDLYAIKELLDRTQGKPKQSIDLDATITTEEKVLTFAEFSEKPKDKPEKKTIKKK